jgi:hypothetical protein
LRNRAALLCFVALAALVGAPGAPADIELREAPSPIIVELAPDVVVGPDHEPDPELQETLEEYAAELRAEREATPDLPPHLQAAYAAAVGGMTVVYNTTDSGSTLPPAAVRSVIDDAVAQWDAVIATNGSGPIVVEVFWRGLGNPSLLGYAGPDGMYQSGGLPTNDLYPAALTNTLLGTDANGPSRPEVIVHLNTELLASNRWYLSSTGTPPAGKIDLFSVVLHEVGHGLGFLGSAVDQGGGPALYPIPYTYDTLARHGSTPIVSAGDQSAALRSGDVEIETSDTIDYDLYAPPVWVPGSSFSHFDEGTYAAGTAGALMTPMLGSSETARILDSPTLGVMARIGWPLTVAATTPTITTASPSLTAAVLSWDRNLWQTGTAPDRYVVQAWRNGSVASSVTVDGTATGAVIGSLGPGATYTIKVVPWGPNGNGAAASAVVQLPTGGGPADPADWPSHIRNTPLDGQLNRLYQAYFLRLADAPGFDYWLGQRARGGSLVDVSSSFAASTEFQNRYGQLNDGTFVDLVYANVLNRTADAEGRAFWLGQLQRGVSRGEVMVGFAESAEYVARTGTVPATDPVEARIVRLYRAFFLRLPDQAGLGYWVGQARAGVPLESIAGSFAQSVEFRNRYGAVSNAQFVGLVYGNVLGRAADPGGASYWTGLLDGGMARGQVMVGFSESPEFVRATGTIPFS